jgi:hypothetical protein
MYYSSFNDFYDSSFQFVFLSMYHYINVFMNVCINISKMNFCLWESLGVSRSIWELLDQNSRVVKLQSL